MHDVTGRPLVGQPMIGAHPYRVLRGGSWNNNNDNNCRSAIRNNNWPDNTNNNIGFRVVVPVPSTPCRQNQAVGMAWVRFGGPAHAPGTVLNRPEDKNAPGGLVGATRTPTRSNQGKFRVSSVCSVCSVVEKE